jgi:hypothetical protein
MLTQPLFSSLDQHLNTASKNSKLFSLSFPNISSIRSLVFLKEEIPRPGIWDFLLGTTFVFKLDFQLLSLSRIVDPFNFLLETWAVHRQVLQEYSPKPKHQPVSHKTHLLKVMVIGTILLPHTQSNLHFPHWAKISQTQNHTA